MSTSGEKMFSSPRKLPSWRFCYKLLITPGFTTAQKYGRKAGELPQPLLYIPGTRREVYER